ncbi:tRNA (adenosine(37)-N6)-threonylcarbamoyltransferase complex ATPase subunit type 1 TsaE [Parasutterella muris]|uniref:tRNA (adenosine(37)-N6)-threonylcarbamoyltransferase complex ATPase subunit type 1 TsaE n=1 Tax=Parasutterella muris TaxID=2565572 RepID=UPI00203FD592|nr:tRNA (adenosine(37)-N6)-threonylcarbamoyltransferase complex ATPase subunit type 1 TsaE [Parasutterella muris]
MNHADVFFQRYLPDEQATNELGAELAAVLLENKDEILSSGLNIRLCGDLGAGKTTLTRALLRALGFEGRVKSPTFTLLELYSIDGFTLNHFDFYRFEDPEEFEDAGFRENFGPGRVCVTEWTQKAEPLVPGADLMISLLPKDDGREVQVSALTDHGVRIVRGLER